MDKREMDRQQEIFEIRSELAYLVELQKCEGYRKFLAPMFQKAHDEHLAGVTNISPDARRETHLHAFHLSARFKTCVDDRISALERKLTDLVEDSEIIRNAEETE